MRAPASLRYKRRVVIALLAFAGLYGLVTAVAFAMQERLTFPAWAMPAAGPLPPGAERLTLDRPDGVRLEGVHIPAGNPARVGPAGNPARVGAGTPLILAFAGNASNAQALAQQLAAIVPEYAVAAFHYRGYGPSTGATAASHLLDDAPFLYDLAAERYRPSRVVLFGQSLGSGVAAGLAARRPTAGLILVTPFDSLKEVARENYWYLPVRLLFRHDMNSVAALASVAAPVAIIAAGRDQLVRPARTIALRRAARNLVHDQTLSDATHNDVAIDPGYPAAIRAALASLSRRGR